MRIRILNVNMARRLQLPLLLFLLFSRSANITASTGHQYILWKSMGGDKNLSILLLLDPFPLFFFSDTDLWRLFPDATQPKRFSHFIHMGRSFSTEQLLGKAYRTVSVT